MKFEKANVLITGGASGIGKIMGRMFRGIPFGFHFIRFWQTVLPIRIFDWFFGDVIGIYHVMDSYTGRKA